MPVATQDIFWVMMIYQRCKAFNCLPFPGGLVDQPEWIMGAFDVIEAAIAKVKKEKQEEARFNQMHKMGPGLNG